ncbi:uncharacterized protein V6R79_001282 [Siganus canaliculatus]
MVSWLAVYLEADCSYEERMDLLNSGSSSSSGEFNANMIIPPQNPPEAVSLLSSVKRYMSSDNMDFAKDAVDLVIYTGG